MLHKVELNEEVDYPLLPFCIFYIMANYCVYVYNGHGRRKHMEMSGFTFMQLKEVLEKHKDNVQVVPKLELYVSTRFWEEELKSQVDIPASKFFSSTNPFGLNIYIDDEIETFEFREVQP